MFKRASHLFKMGDAFYQEKHHDGKRLYVADAKWRHISVVLLDTSLYIHCVIDMY